MPRMDDIPASTSPASDPLSAFNIPGNMFNPLDSFNQAWRTMQTASPFPPTMSVADLEKRIAELRTVEQWLSLNLDMLRGSIQTLEIQKGTLQALGNLSARVSPDALQAAMGSTSPSSSDTAAGAMDTATQLSQQWWKMLQAQLGQFSGMVGLQPGADGPAAAGASTAGHTSGSASSDAPTRSTGSARAGRSKAPAGTRRTTSTASTGSSGTGGTAGRSAQSPTAAHSRSTRRSSGPKPQES